MSEVTVHLYFSRGTNLESAYHDGKIQKSVIIQTWQRGHDRSGTEAREWHRTRQQVVFDTRAVIGAKHRPVDGTKDAMPGAAARFPLARTPVQAARHGFASRMDRERQARRLIPPDVRAQRRRRDLVRPGAWRVCRHERRIAPGPRRHRMDRDLSGK